MKGMTSQRLNRWYLTIFLTFIFLPGCVYFNTFFMAKKKFKEAEELQKENLEVRREQEFSQNKNQGNTPVGGGRTGNPSNPAGRNTPGTPVAQKVNPQERNLYDDAIKKASKVLTNHPDSKWADDALWLIGKAYFNMGDYTPADRKFKELVTNHPDSKFADDAYYYMGLCQDELDNDELALDAFARVEREFPKSEYLKYIAFTRGRIAMNEKEYEDAIDLFKAFLEKYGDSDSAAMAEYYTGLSYEQLGKNYEAYSAYSEVKRRNPDRQLEFDAILAAGSVILKTDSVSVGMKILSDLSKDERYFSRMAKIRLKIAEGYRLENEIDRAIQEYTVICEENQRTIESAEAYYNLGLIYQNYLFDIEKAKDSFTKAQNESQSSEFRNLSLARSAQIAKFEAYRIQLQRADSVKAILDGDTLRVETGESEPVEVSPVDSTIAIAEDSTGQVPVKPPAVRETPFAEIMQNVKPSENPDFSDSSTLQTDTSLVDSTNAADSLTAEGKTPDSTLVSVANEIDFIGPLPESTHIEIAVQDSTSGAGLDTVKTSTAPVNQDSLLALEAKRQAREDSIRQAIIATGIETRYLLAELYSYELGQPDSALNEYRIIIDQYPESQYAAKGLLASAILKQEAGDAKTAEDYLTQLIDRYPESPQAARAAEILGMQMDLSENAVGLYAAAESLYFEGNNPDSAAVLFGYIAKHFPDLAPKAAFARAEAIDKATAGADSSAYFAYDEVTTTYPQSIYAEAAKGKLGRLTPKRAARGAGAKRPQEDEIEEDTQDTTTTLAGFPVAPPVKKLGEFIYPQSLLERRLKGEVLFKIKIDLFGKVVEHEIIGPSGEYAIDSSATAALLETEFDTSRLDLSQLDSYYTYTIPFERPDINIFNDPYREENRDRY